MPPLPGAITVCLSRTLRVVETSLSVAVVEDLLEDVYAALVVWQWDYERALKTPLRYELGAIKNGGRQAMDWRREKEEIRGERVRDKERDKDTPNINPQHTLSIFVDVQWNTPL